MIGGFGAAGQPVELIEALIESGARDLTVVNNNAGNGDRGLAALIREGRVRKIICSFPRQADSWHFDAQYRAGEIELELVPQGNLAERIRAAGAGIGGVLHADRLRHAAGRGQGGRARSTGAHYVLEYPIRADVALVAAQAGRPRSATSSTARPPATSGRSWRPPPTTTVVQVRELRAARRHRPRARRDARAVRRPGRATLPRSGAGADLEEGQ